MQNLYKKYLQTEEWKAKANACKKLADYKCSKCDNTSNLHAHHNTYERVGEELQEDLECLCSECHAKEHNRDLFSASSNRYNIPIKNITSRINAMDLFNVMEQVCKSSKDIIITNKLTEKVSKENEIRIDNISKLAEEFEIARSKLNNILKSYVDTNFMHKLDRGVYMINPNIFVGKRVRSNKLREEAQIKWNQLIAKDK